jgi:hypothetical protein
MKKVLKKITILTLLLSLGVVVSACLKNPQTNQNINQLENINTNTIKETEPRQQEEDLEEIILETEEIDISDWQTYRNEEYGFEFRYPRDWNIDYDKKDGISINLYDNNLQISWLSIRLNKTKGIFYQSINEFALLSCNEYGGMYCNRPTVYKFNNIRLYSYSGSNFFDNNTSSFVSENYIFYIGGKIFNLFYSIADGDGKIRSNEQINKSNIEAKAIILSLKIK